MEDPLQDFEINGYHHSKSLPSSHSPTLNHRNNHHHHHHRHHDHHLSIFPPINHEDLPIPPPLPPPQSLQYSNSTPDPPKPIFSHLLKNWFDFSLRLWHSKLFSLFALLRSYGFFLPLASMASFLSFFWFLLRWWRRRRRRRLYGGGMESVEDLKAVIKEKDKKIVELLEQISHLHKVLLARYKIAVLKAT